VARAAELGHTTLALTDVNGLYGATRFWKHAVAAGIRPLLGAELRADGAPVVALVESDVGYENLCRIITRILDDGAESSNLTSHISDSTAQISNFKSQISERATRNSELRTVLSDLADGLHFIAPDAAAAEGLLHADVPAGQLWLGVDPPSQSAARVARLVQCAQRTGLPLVATGAALTAREDDADVARLLAAIREGKTYDTVPPAALPHARAVLRSPDRLAHDLADLPRAVENNYRLAERCSAFRLLPREPVFPGFRCPGGLPAARYLHTLCRAGMRRRYGDFPPAAAEGRLETELGLIEKLGFSEYFLVVREIVQYARRRGAPVAGRGSGASSLVAYVLGITNVCPIAYDIPFERFLHEGREDFPDLDVDFCWRIRDEVIDYAFDRWGRQSVAMVSVHTTFQQRGAFREAARALGCADDEISRFEKEGVEPSARGRGDEGVLGRIVHFARKLHGLPHVLSVHPGGIVIAPRGIDRHVPVQRAAKGVMICQYDKDGVEDIRLVKIDLLGNRNLSTVRHACDLLRARGAPVDIEMLPPADPETVALMRRGETIGCNQLESPAMRHLLRSMRPAGAGDVMKALALIRPGAASLGMKEAFIRRRRGLEAPPPAPPRVRGVLAGTHGVMLYEDDVMLLAAAMMGTSLAEGDRFRKAVQKCRTDERRRELSGEFLRRCAANGIELPWARDIWVQMAKFNAYSFCRAHAGSYALLAYAGAYLKAHHPLEFWAAALNNNQGMYHPRVYVEEARRRGVRFLRPDVNRSEAEFAIEDGALRVGLGFVDAIGPAGVRRVLDERERGGPFEGVTDFLLRTRLGREETRALVLCGAFDFAGRPRPAMMMELNLVLTMRSVPRQWSQPSLLTAAPVVPAPPGDYTPGRKRADERRVLGICLDEHILSHYRPRLAARVDATSADLPARAGRRVRLAGVLEARRVTDVRDGGRMMFLTLDDEWGLFEVTVFPDALRRLRLKFREYGPYIVEGKVEDQHGAVTVTAESVSLCRMPGPLPDPHEQHANAGAYTQDNIAAARHA